MTQQPRPIPIKVLLVENRLQDQIAFQQALIRSGVPFEVTLRERAEEIPSALQAGNEIFDIVVVDQDLPGMTGLAAYLQLQRETALPPFIMLTGAGSENLAVKALQAGMYDYIIKDPHQGYLNVLAFKLQDVCQRHADRHLRLTATEELQEAHAELERQVAERTAQLGRVVEALKSEIAEREQTERALRESRRALKALSWKIVEAQENERRMMAKELHDSIGGSLAAIKFAVEGKLQSMADAPPRDVISLEKIVAHIQDTITEVRRISTSLRPSMLDDLGLPATIQWFCRSSAEMYPDTRIDTQLAVDGETIPDLFRIVIYRVLQEALHNALRHSGADRVAVRLDRAAHGLRLTVADNGCGFDTDAPREEADPLSGYGLQGMRDRAEVVGGSLVVVSRVGQGTTVRLDLPDEPDRA